MTYLKLSVLKKYEDAIKQYGKDAQINMMIEEASELVEQCGALIKNLIKLSRTNTDKTQQMQHMFICEEIADLEIMLEQSHFIFDGQMIDKIKAEKIERLGKRLKK